MPPAFRPRVALLLLAAPLAALTCDDARRDAPLAARVAQAFCAHQFACCSPFELTMLSSDRYKTEAECVEFATLAARQQLGTVEGAIAQGRITIDGARADACLAAYRDQPCGSGNMPSPLQPIPERQISPLPNAGDVLAFCQDMLIGHVANNRDCNLSQECLRGSRCVSGTSTTFPGAPPPGFGGSSGTVVAAPGICTPYQQAGELCNASGDCDPTRLSCRMPDYVCGAKPQRGEPCTIQFDQFTGSVLTDCEGAEGLTCDQFTLTCQPYPGDGQPCNPFGLPQCDPDPTLALSCNQFSGTCRRPGAEGAPCGAPAIPPCRADLACHPTQPDGIGTCGAVPALGEPCADRCASPAVCASGTCVSTGAAAVGEPCASDADCSSLSCNGFQGGRRVCGVPPYTFAQCMGAGITAARVTGAGGIGGPMGTAGSFGGPDGGVGARGTPPTGAGGMGGTGNTMPTGCLSSDIAPGDPMIADFGVDMGGMAVLPIGGTFTYGSPAPTAFVSNKAWHLTLTASGIDGTPLFLGAGIFFNRCTDATAHTGVQFDISGTVGGTGCTAQYATNDSAHMDVTFDPKGAGPAGSWSPQAPLAVTTTPTTVLMPFVGTGAPTGGSPPIPIDPSKLTGVQWQFTVASGTTNGCIVDVTIDNVRFF